MNLYKGQATVPTAETIEAAVVASVAASEHCTAHEIKHNQQTKMMDALAAYSWFGQLSVVVSVVAVCWTMVWQNLEHIRLQQFFARNINRRARRLAAIVDPYLSLTFEEYEGGRIKSSDAFKEVRSYLTTASTRDVRHLRAECGGGGDKLVLTMAKGEEVPDAFRGATVWWSADAVPPPLDAVPYWSRASRAERRYFRLEFHESHRDLVLNHYVPHVRRQGRAIMVQNRQRRLYTNIHREDYDDGYTTICVNIVKSKLFSNNFY